MTGESALVAGKRKVRRRQRSTGSKPRQRKDGRWVASARGLDPDGQQRRFYVYAATRDAVLAKREELLEQLRQRGVNRTRPDRRTLAAFLDDWLRDSARPRVRDTTHRLYKLVVERHLKNVAGAKGSLKPGLGHIRLDHLDARQIRAHYASLERNGRSPRMRQLAHVVLHQALKDAVRLDVIPRNPCANVDPPRVARRAMKVWTPEQVRQFLNAARGDRYAALYVLAFASGMRKGELLALRWEDVDLDAAALSVRNTLADVGGTWRLAEPKTDRGRRRIDLPAAAVDALRDQRERLLAEGLRASPWCFPSRAKTKCFGEAVSTPTNTRNLVRYSFDRLIVKAELPRIRFHDIRHTAASMWLAAGIHPKIVQERLGHASIGITLDVYSHVLPSVHREAADRIGAILA